MITSESIKEFVLANPNLVKQRETSIPGLYVLKYAKKCFYNNIWNEYIENCRGAVVDKNFNLISNPFRKIYNFGIESNAPEINDWEYVSAYRKVNGFMLAISLYQDELLFSTTGSIDSEFAKMGQDLFFSNVSDVDIRYFKNYLKFSNRTCLYECVHPNDPHIIVEEPGLYYLGNRKNEWNSNILDFPTPGMSRLCCGKLVDRIWSTMGDLKDHIKTVEHEGYVVYADDNRTTKIKSPYYLISKFLARCNTTNRLLDKNIKEKFDEEYYGLIDQIHEDIENFTRLDEQNRLKYIRNYIENIL